MTETTASGLPTWVDLSTSDLEAARHFYGALFGWTFAETATVMGNHHVASVGEQPVAGMMALTPDRADGPAYWALFFGVDDVDSTVSRIEAAGGKAMHAPIDVDDDNRVVAVADVTGALFVLSSRVPVDEYFSQQAGAISWCELMTRDPAASNKFYADVFDWASSADTTDTGTVYTVYELGERHGGGMIETPAHVPADVPDNWSVYFTVDDCAAVQAKAVELGGNVLLPTTNTPMGPFAVLSDPQGGVFQIMEFCENDGG